jgi:hypothetical protein
MLANKSLVLKQKQSYTLEAKEHSGIKYEVQIAEGV